MERRDLILALAVGGMEAPKMELEAGAVVAGGREEEEECAGVDWLELLRLMTEMYDVCV